MCTLKHLECCSVTLGKCSAYNPMRLHLIHYGFKCYVTRTLGCRMICCCQCFGHDIFRMCEYAAFSDASELR